ncbi:MAG: PE-PPE domain-containing protein [Mycobacterium sp.]|nr:PE-PPE domain-containing protein [Mycobacterium sp.]
MNKSAAALGLMSAVILAPAVVSPVTAHAATAVIMGPTFMPDPAADPDYLRVVALNFIGPTTNCTIGNCTLVPLTTPAEFWPITGLDDLTIDQSIAVGLQLLNAELGKQIATAATEPTVFFGASQSATLLTLAKGTLADLGTLDKSRLIFVLLANPNRPNGGLMARAAPTSIPDSGVTAAVATPTDTGIATIDITFQYDAVADYPAYPSNFLSVLNTLAGARIHSGSTTTLNGYSEAELTAAISDPANRQIYGDTMYITIPAKSLPLVDLLRTFGAENRLSNFTTPIADLIEPTMRLLVELGYDRTSYGQAQPFGPLPANNQLQFDALRTAAASAGLDAVIAALKQGAAGPSSGPVSGGWNTSRASRGTVRPRHQTASTTTASPPTVSGNQAKTADVVSAGRRSAPSAVGQRGTAQASKAGAAKRQSATA